MLLGAVCVERVVELVVARRHATIARAEGAVEAGRRHYPLLVGLHVGLLAGCAVEPGVRRRTAPSGSARPRARSGAGRSVPARVLPTSTAPEPADPAGGSRRAPVPAASMAGLVVAAQALRWWCVRSLGGRWNTRVLVVPGAPLVRRGPYRVLNHPNYLAVVVEGAALPLAGGATVTAGAFGVLDLVLLAVRIRCENAALAAARPPGSTRPG